MVKFAVSYSYELHLSLCRTPWRVYLRMSQPLPSLTSVRVKDLKEKLTCIDAYESLRVE